MGEFQSFRLTFGSVEHLLAQLHFVITDRFRFDQRVDQFRLDFVCRFFGRVRRIVKLFGQCLNASVTI